MTHAPSAHLRQVLDDGRAPTEQRRPRWHHPLEERLGEVVEIVPQAVALPPYPSPPRRPPEIRRSGSRHEAYPLPSSARQHIHGGSLATASRQRRRR